MDAPDALIRGELAKGERLLWTGRPRQGVVLRPGDFMTIPMGCAWCAAVGFAIVLAVRDGSWPLALGAVGFSLPGLYLLFGRLWTDAFQRSRTAYALTERRLLFVRRLPRIFVGSQVRSFHLANVTTVTLREGRRGGGTITFGGRTREEAWAVMSGIPGADDYVLPTFDLAENAREVYALVLAAQQNLAMAGGAQPVAQAVPPRPDPLSLRRRQAIVAGIVGLALAALLRWEQWECRDANGNVLVRRSGLLWSGQQRDYPPIDPRQTREIVTTTARLVPPLIQRRAVPVPLTPNPPRGAVVPGS